MVRAKAGGDVEAYDVPRRFLMAVTLILGVAAVLALILLVGSGVLWVLAQLGGWAALAKRYRADSAPSGLALHFRSARFGGFVSYNNILTMVSNERGLYLALPMPFHVAHPPLFLPWEDIQIAEQEKRFFSYVLFTVHVDREVTLRVWQPVGEEILVAAGRRSDRRR